MFGLVLFWLMTTAAEDPYCTVRYKRLCQSKGHHIACVYPDPGPGVSCSNYTAIDINEDIKSFILHYMNRRRQRIASGKERVRGGVLLPKPELMMLVMWDRELAFLAQRLADQCNFVHDDCRATVRYPYAGQAVGEVRWRGTGMERDARRAIRRVLDAWWGERRRVTPQQLTSPFHLSSRGAVWGHFSQLCVWNLQAMGCGAVQHSSSPRLLLVCDFSHTNMLGQRTLTPGPFAPCPAHTVRKSSQYPLLCTPVRKVLPKEPEEEYEDNEDDAESISTVAVTVSTPVTKYSRTTYTQSERWIESSAMEFRERAMSEGEANEELKLRHKAEHKIRLAEQLRRRPMGRQYEDLEHVIPLYQTTVRPVDHYDIEHHTSTAGIIDPISFPRHRWKQTRDRPRRPGANALLFTQAMLYSKRPSVAPLMLDKEDVDQLFRDTGFKMTQKNNSYVNKFL